MPWVISTRHSLHLPCLRQEVGTLTPSNSAQSNKEGPGATSRRWSLKCNSTLISAVPDCASDGGLNTTYSTENPAISCSRELREGLDVAGGWERGESGPMLALTALHFQYTTAAPLQAAVDEVLGKFCPIPPGVLYCV